MIPFLYYYVDKNYADTFLKELNPKVIRDLKTINGLYRIYENDDEKLICFEEVNPMKTFQGFSEEKFSKAFFDHIFVDENKVIEMIFKNEQKIERIKIENEELVEEAGLKDIDLTSEFIKRGFIRDKN